MKLKFSAQIEVPDGTPMEDIQRWLEFELGANSSLSNTNAMSHTDLMSLGCRRVEVDEDWR